MEKYDDFEEEMSDVELWISEYRETLTRWALTGDRKDAQDAFHDRTRPGGFLRRLELIT